MTNPQHLLLFTILSLAPIFSLSQTPPNCIDTSPIVPTIPLVSFLERLQETALVTFGPDAFDPKLYVDQSLKSDLADTEQGFENLPKTINGSVLATDLNAFMKDYLNGADEDLVYVDPADFVRSPEGFLPGVESVEMRDWALEVHSLWKLLSRRVADGVVQKPELHSLLPLPEPVMIPGSRFREVYYWDSYWVIRGLLASKMYDTAKGIVTNLISLIDEFGYVLNGARAYYTNRSQPPLLSSMIYDIYNRTGDMDFLKKSLPALLKEHDFWNSGVHSVTIRDSQGNNHMLSRYFAKWNQPRPESSTIDQETASILVDDYEKQRLYREIASAAESGWDFSTRWMMNSSDLTTLAATSILPVDLNSFIMKMELDIAYLSNVTGDWATSLRFSEFAQTRKMAMNSILWNEEKDQWLDYWLSSNGTCKFSDTWEASNQNKNAYASNFSPLWVELFYSDEVLVEKVMQSLQNSGLVREVGIATSLINSSQQWDLPNGWAPLQHLIVEGLVKSGSTQARALAQDIAIRWITTNYVAYKTSGSMHEKYDVDHCGEFGGGGEYVPQTGFGWSNGVVLAFLEEFGWPQDLKTAC